MIPLGRADIEISQGWNLQVWHVPGHSDGHLAIYDEKEPRRHFTSDAVQAGSYPTIDGRQAFRSHLLCWWTPTLRPFNFSKPTYRPHLLRSLAGLPRN